MIQNKRPVGEAPDGKVWSDVAIKYIAGIDITDPVTDKIFTDEEARQQTPDVRRRLVNRGREVGCWVKK